MKVVYNRGALRDLEGIRDYIARSDRQAAVKVVARLKEVAELLGNAPLLGRPGPCGARLLSVTGLPFVIIHRIRGDTVAIVAVFHTSRNRKFR